MTARQSVRGPLYCRYPYTSESTALSHFVRRRFGGARIWRGVDRWRTIRAIPGRLVHVSGPSSAMSQETRTGRLTHPASTAPPALSRDGVAAAPSLLALL